MVITLLFPVVSHAQDGEEVASPTLVAVETDVVVRTILRKRVTAYGMIEPEPSSGGQPAAMVRLSPAVPGIITEVEGVEGQRVTKGDVLFALDSRAAEAALAMADMAVNFALKNAERQRALMAAGGTSEKQLLETEQALAGAQAELAAAEVSLSLLIGEAPISGTLTKFFARNGEAADSANVLAEIVDLDRLVAAVRVPRADLTELKAGQQALLRASGGETPIEATVSFVGPQVDPSTGTVPARLALPKGSGLSLGQFIVATIVVQEKPDCFAVPREAVYTDPDGQSTLSIVTDGVARKTIVTTGLRDGNLVEVEGEGVSEGITVVTVGSYGLPDEVNVRAPTP